MADGTLARFARHLVLAIEPLREALTDVGRFEAFIARLGWTVTSFPPPYQDLRPLVEAALDALDELAEDPDPQDVLALLDRAGDVHRALAAIDEAPGGIASAEVPTFLGELTERVVELLLTDHLMHELPTAYQLAAMTGVIVTEYHPATDTRPEFLRSRLVLDRLPDLLADPGPVVSRLYGWGTAQFRFGPLADDLSALLWALNRTNRVQLAEAEFAEGYRAVPLERADKRIELELRTILFEPRPAGGDEVGFSVLELPAEDDLLPGVVLQPALPDVTGALVLTPDWTLRLRPETDPERLFGVLIRPGALRIRFPLAPGTPPPPAGFGATLEYRPDRATLLLGAADGSRVEFTGATFGFRIDLVNGVPVLEGDLRLDNLAVVVTSAELDGFLAGLVGRDSIRIPIPLGVTWSSAGGFGFTLGAGFEVVRHPDLSLGPLTVTTLSVAVRMSGDTLALEVGTGLRCDLGPVGVLVEGLGLVAELAFEDGNAGPFDIGVGLRLPTGLGLSLDAGPVTGGGFLQADSAAGRYAGALAVQLERLSVVGVGLLDTRAPGVDFALLVLLSARFEPGIQLGWGFELTGVGGLLAVNRRIDLDALQERFATGAAARLLAVEAVTDASNLPAILREVETIFPVADGVYVVGPTVRLRWIRLVTIDAGVFLEFPGPTRVVVLGTARATVDNPLASGPLVQLRADFVGVLDLQRATFAFDATLVDSRLLESFPLTGDILFRAGWGDEPYTVLSVGGFHPDFHPGNLPVPKTIDRLAMSYGHPDDRLYLRFEGYFAITSNSVQFGASVEVSAKLGPFRIMGFIGFDALIRFEPFYFSISFKASVRLKWKGRTLAGISVSGTLSGPGPVKFTGRACVEVLFFDICKSGSFEIGSDAPPVVRQIPSALTMLALELRDPANLRAATEDRSVVLRALPANPPVLAPTGVIWEQTRAPLGLLLERFEGTPLGFAETVTASSEQLTGEELDWFAPGSFAELSDAEALTRRSFERLASGVRLAAGPDETSVGVPHDVEVLEFLLPAPTPRPPDRNPSITAPGWLLEAVQVREGLAHGRLAPPAFRTAPERWRVVDVDGAVLATTGESQAHQLARSAGRRAVALPALDQITLTEV
jgi:hypothetical protein